jgi:hypothetical protein
MLSQQIYCFMLLMALISINLQIDTTKDVLKSLNADSIERLLVLTKKEIALSVPRVSRRLYLRK